MVRAGGFSVHGTRDQKFSREIVVTDNKTSRQDKSIIFGKNLAYLSRNGAI
jgi:hypothetical protein